MSSQGMQLWLATIAPADLAGIATASLLNSKLIRSTRLQTQWSVKPLASRNTTSFAEKSWWDTPPNGVASFNVLADGSTSMTTIKPWMPNTWRVSGTHLKKFTRRALFTEAQRSCHFQLHVIPSSPTSKQALTTKKSQIPQLSLLSQLPETNTTPTSSLGLPLLGPCQAIWLSPLMEILITVGSLMMLPLNHIFASRSVLRIVSNKLRLQSIQSTKHSKVKLSLVKATNHCSLISRNARPIIASVLSIVTMLPMMLVLVLSIAHQVSVRKIINAAWRLALSMLVVHQFPLIKTVNSWTRSPSMLASTSKMLINKFRLIWRLLEDFSALDQLSILIHSAGGRKHLYFTEDLAAGSLKLLTSKINLSKITSKQSGFPISSKKKDSTTGLLTPKTGASQETDTGVTPSQSGFPMTVRKQSVSDQSRSLKNYLDRDHLLTSIENTSIISRSLPSRAKECWRESQKCLTAGLKVELCPSLNPIIHSVPQRKNSWKDSQPTSLLKASIKPVVGSTPSWLFPPPSKELLHSKTWFAMELCLPKTEPKCQRARRTILIQSSWLINMEQMLHVYIFAIVQSSVLNLLGSQLKASKQ